MPLAYIALGANLGDPAAQVNDALPTLDSLPATRLQCVSSLYRTAPVGVSGQADFINAVCAVETALAPEVLLDALLTLETRFGRRRDYPLAPRPLDLDLLLYAEQIIDTPRLILPHPRMHLRAFVLVPLCEIAPDCRIPGRGKAASWLPAVCRQGIEKV